MPFIANTPESLIARSDSKNPNTTCRGITSNGRPCRRPLDASTTSAPASFLSKNKKGKGMKLGDPGNPDSYCWQHKDQAALSAKSSPGGSRFGNPTIPERRESVETLIDRLGIVEAEQKKKTTSSTRPHGDGRPSSAVRPGSEHRNEKLAAQTAHTSISVMDPPGGRKTNSHTFCCCFTIPAIEEEQRPVRPNPRPLQNAPIERPSSRIPSGQYLSTSSASRPRPSATTSSPSKPSSSHSAVSQTSQYLSLIPPTASPQTASLLMAELAKGVSTGDEPGYIYIFWLTPESETDSPQAKAANSLLSPPRSSAGRQRRPSEVMETFATKAEQTKAQSPKKTVLLKIGRASNVQRRLNEWTRQCGYNLSLVRYYPYVSADAPTTVRKMPHSHKVERLIHLELAGAGLRVSDRQNWMCPACGKAHKEWFEVDASRNGIMRIDEIVKRWSDWDETSG